VKFEMGVDRGFATQTLYQLPKVKALHCKAFTFGSLKFANLNRIDFVLA
jgi:hypothetical protein